MLANPELRDDARHSVSEHKEIDDFLGALADLDTASTEWTETFGKMRHRYEHHIDEEEERCFPPPPRSFPARRKRGSPRFSSAASRRNWSALKPPGGRR